MKKYLATILAVVLLVTTGVLLNAPKARAGYTYSRTIQTTAAQIPASQSNFTVLVCANGTSPCNGSVTGLNQTGGGAHVQNSNGYDIVFSSVSDCSSGLYNWEMEKYVASTGEMEAWVLITSLGTTTNQFYMCYGNSAISTFQGGSTGSAWNTSYKGVWHFPNGTSLSANDSTSNSGSNTPTINGATAVAGQIDGGANFGDTNRNISIASGALDFTGNFTFETWVYTTVSDVYQCLIENSGVQRDYAIFLSSNGTSNVYLSANGNIGDVTLSTPWSVNAWNHIAYTADGTNLKVYVNGVLSNTTSSSQVASNGNGQTFFGEGNQGTAYQLYGNMDEARVSSTARSADWIKTEYNNQSAPGSFITFGNETTNGGGATASSLVKITNVTVKIRNAKVKIIGN